MAILVLLHYSIVNWKQIVNWSMFWSFLYIIALCRIIPFLDHHKTKILDEPSTLNFDNPLSIESFPQLPIAKYSQLYFERL